MVFSPEVKNRHFVLELPSVVFGRKRLLTSCARARIVSQRLNIKYVKVIDLSMSFARGTIRACFVLC